jgi:hypothetical protein
MHAVLCTSAGGGHMQRQGWVTAILQKNPVNTSLLSNSSALCCNACCCAHVQVEGTCNAKHGYIMAVLAVDEISKVRSCKRK